jgi:hypothetical protein
LQVRQFDEVGNSQSTTMSLHSQENRPAQNNPPCVSLGLGAVFGKFNGRPQRPNHCLCLLYAHLSSRHHYSINIDIVNGACTHPPRASHCKQLPPHHYLRDPRSERLSFLIIIFLITRRKRAHKHLYNMKKQQPQKYPVIDEEQARQSHAIREYRQVQQEDVGLELGGRAPVSQGGAEQTQTQTHGVNASAMAMYAARPVEMPEQSLRR